MNLKERANVVRAMETMVRCINNESIFDSWLMVGVADGDINGKETDEDLEYYCRDGNFKELMTLFLKLMRRAGTSGGLYTDGIVSGEAHLEWR